MDNPSKNISLKDKSPNGPYGYLGISELQALLKQRKLISVGTRSELITRLEISDNFRAIKITHDYKQPFVSPNGYNGQIYLSSRCLPLDVLVYISLFLTLRDLHLLSKEYKEISQMLLESKEFWRRRHKLAHPDSPNVIPYGNYAKYYINISMFYLRSYIENNYRGGIMGMSGYELLNEVRELAEKGEKILTKNDFNMALTQCKGNLALIKFLVSQGANNYTNILGNAVVNGKLETVKYLMSLEKNIDALRSWAFHVSLDGTWDMIQYFISLNLCCPNTLLVGAANKNDMDRFEQALRLGATNYNQILSDVNIRLSSQMISRLLEIKGVQFESRLRNWPPEFNSDDDLLAFRILLSKSCQSGDLLQRMSERGMINFVRIIYEVKRSELTQEDINLALIKAIKFQHEDLIFYFLENSANNYSQIVKMPKFVEILFQVNLLVCQESEQNNSEKKALGCENLNPSISSKVMKKAGNYFRLVPRTSIEISRNILDQLLFAAMEIKNEELISFLVENGATIPK